MKFWISKTLGEKIVQRNYQVKQERYMNEEEKVFKTQLDYNDPNISN